MIFQVIGGVADFATAFTLPYLLQAPYANLGPKVGFLYGSVSAVGIIGGWFYLPEMTQKSLEEIDEMFEARVPAWKTRGELSTLAT